MNNLNYDLFGGETEIPVKKRGRPVKHEVNLDYVEQRNVSLNESEMKLFVKKTKQGIKDRALVDLGEEATDMELEERDAFRSIMLVEKYWPKPQQH